MADAQRGISLIEVLVSLVILSLGVLAVVALQLVAKRNNADAAQRTIAAQLAFDLLERMRANSLPARLNEYRTAANSPLGRDSMNVVTVKDCRTSTCTNAELVTYDRWVWEQALDGAAETKGGVAVGGLLYPTGCVNGPAGGGDGLYTVTIVWRGTVGIPDPDTGDTADASATGCGRDLQVGSAYIYGEDTNGDGVAEDNDRLRRSVSISAYITARTI